MIYHEQISVAPFCRIFVHTLSVPVSRVAVKARLADIRRTETVEWRRVCRYIALKEQFATVKVVRQSHLRHCWSLVLIASCRYVVGRSEFASGIPFRRFKVSHSLADEAYVVRIAGTGVDVVVV